MMKKTKIVWLASLLSAISFLSTGCVATKGSLSSRVGNFAVKAEDTVEIGQYYTPDVPKATIDGKHAFVGVEATQGDNKLFFNGSNALLVESFEDITITYTIAEGTQKLTKSTTVKVQDTTAPYIVGNTLPEAIYRGRTFQYQNYIRVGDLSGDLLERKISITDQNGEPIKAQNGAITLPEDSAVETVTFSVTAKDGKNNSASKTFTLPVLNAALWNKPLDFEALDVSAITTRTAGTSVEAVEKDGGKALKITHNPAWKGETSYSRTLFKFTEDISSYTCFDYVKLVVSVKTNCDIEIWKAKSGNKFKASTEESAKTELIYDMKPIREANGNVVASNCFQLQLALCEGRHQPAPANLDVEFYVYSYEFGYYEWEVLDDRPIDVSEFGIAQDEVLESIFTPEVGEAKAIGLENWIPRKGTLTLTVKKGKYRTTTIEIPITLKSELVNNGSDNDTDVEFNW